MIIQKYELGFQNHGAHTVHAFITRIIEHIKQVIPNVGKIHYFR